MREESLTGNGTFIRSFFESNQFQKKSWIWYWIALISFPFIKGIIRPLVLEWDSESVMALILLSYPNFVEGVIGFFSVSVVLVLIRFKFEKTFPKEQLWLYLITSLISGVYVITQELKIHNLGGHNIYDPNDIIASVLGITTAFFLVLKFGLFRKKHQVWESQSNTYSS